MDFQLPFYKYQGTGNDFILIDNRSLFFPKENEQLIAKLCHRKFGIGADGLIVIENDEAVDFKMVYFNSDGKESSMCGNGGRCIVAFAKKLQLIEKECVFSAIDGLHQAKIVNNEVSLQMIDVVEINKIDEAVFLNSGSPHHIEMVKNTENVAVCLKGKEIRYSQLYKSINGANVNFVEQVSESIFKIRTYERGVENETLSCGTGATAVALAMHWLKKTEKNKVSIQVLGGELKVEFQTKEKGYQNIWLSGLAMEVFQGTINIKS